MRTSLFEISNPNGYQMVFSTDGKNKGEWTVHFVFMIVGCGGFMTLAVNAHRIFPFHRDTNRIIHVLLHTCALAAVGLAFFYIFFITANNDKGKAQVHFSNVHGQLGIGLVSGFAFLYVSTLLITYILPLSPRLRTQIIPFHRFLGFALYATAMAQMIMAIWEQQSHNKVAVTSFGIQISLIVCILAGLWSTIYNIYHRNTYLGVAQSPLFLENAAREERI